MPELQNQNKSAFQLLVICQNSKIFEEVETAVENFKHNPKQSFFETWRQFGETAQKEKLAGINFYRNFALGYKILIEQKNLKLAQFPEPDADKKDKFAVEYIFERHTEKHIRAENRLFGILLMFAINRINQTILIQEFEKYAALHLRTWQKGTFTE